MASSSYQNGASREGDFEKISQTVGTNVQKISQNVTSMQRIVNQLGTSLDNQQLRNQLHQITHYTGQLAKDTNKSIKDLNSLPLPFSLSEQRLWKLQKERLTNDFSAALHSFQDTQRIAATKEKEEIKKARANTFADNSRSPDTLIKFEGEDQRRTQIQLEDDVDMAMLEERERAIRQLESDIVDVNTIFKDLATMVHEQGETIDSIEAHVEAAQLRVEEGTSQLGKAANYQSKLRTRKCMLLIIGCVVLAIVIGIIAWQAS